MLKVARLLKIPLLAGERNLGAPIELKSFAKSGIKRHLVVVFPNLFWNFRWQRPQQLFSHCAQEGYTVLFISLKTNGVRGEIRDIYEASDYVELRKNADNVIDVKLPTRYEKFVLNDSFTKEDINSMSLALSSVLFELSEIWKLKFPEVTFVVEHPNWQPLATQVQSQIKGKMIFDLMDNHRGFDQVSQAATRMELKLLKTVDSTVVSSLFLKEYAQKYTEKITIIRNATDYECFSNCKKNNELDSLENEPIIGYFGALNEWFDMELVSSIATAHPEWNIVLIGSLSPCNFSSVEKLKNIFFLGEKSYNELPGYLAYFDVCIIPFKLNPLTLATNPVKYYEYISAGKQVVSTSLPELIPYNENCHLADTEEMFIREIQQILNLKNTKADKLQAKKNKLLAKRNTWEKRWNRLKSLF